jgi:hypothetical protein
VKRTGPSASESDGLVTGELSGEQSGGGRFRPPSALGRTHLPAAAVPVEHPLRPPLHELRRRRRRRRRTLAAGARTAAAAAAACSIAAEAPKRLRPNRSIRFRTDSPPAREARAPKAATAPLSLRNLIHSITNADDTRRFSPAERGGRSGRRACPIVAGLGAFEPNVRVPTRHTRPSTAEALSEASQTQLMGEYI